MGIEKLESHIAKLEDDLKVAQRQLEEFNESEKNRYKLPIKDIQNFSDEEIGKKCKSLSYFNAVSMMSKQFDCSINLSSEFAGRSLAELVVRCTE